jgi:outer membrane cobalamin receptor
MKLKINILSVILIITTQNIFSYTISGRVVDTETNNQLDLVHIKSDNKVTYTNKDGEFKLEDVQEGTINLTISRVGYKAKELTLEVNSDLNDLLFELKKTQVNIDEVEVVKGRQWIIKREIDLEPASMIGNTVVLKSEYIEKTGAKNLIEAMKYTPSSLIETRGRKIKQFYSFRGQTYPYPTYLVNGIWQKEFSEIPYFFNTEEIEEIKIVRSSASLLTGLNGLSGVIDVRTKEFSENFLKLKSSYGTFNTLHSNFSNSNVFEKFAYKISASYMSTDGPDDMNAGEKISNFNLALRWTPIEDLKIVTRAYYIHGERELANAKSPAHKKFRDTQAKYDPFKTLILSSQANYNFSDFTNSRLSISYADKTPKYVYHSGGEQKSIEEEESEITIDYLQAFLLNKNNTLRVGGLYNRWKAPKGKRFYYGNECDLETFSAVATDEHSFGDLHLDLGVRYTSVLMNKFGTFPMSNTGTVYKKKMQPIVDEWEKPNLQSSIGLSYKFFQTSNLRFNVSNEAVRPKSGSVKKNSDGAFVDVDDENRLKFDLSYGFINEMLGLNISSFYNNRSNAIIYSPETHETVEGDLLPIYLNKDMRQYGLELAISSHALLYKSTKLFINGTYMKSEIKNNGDFDKYKLYPNFIANAGLNFNLKNFSFNAYAKYVSEFENSRFSEDKKMHKLGNFFNMDLTTEYKISGYENIALFGEVKNLFDKEYSTVVGYYDFGRVINLGFKFKI